MKALKPSLAKCKAIFQRGSSWLDIVYSKFALTIIFLKLFEDFFKSFGVVSMTPLYVLGVILVAFACFGIGLLDLKRGIWLEENNTSWEYTPKANNMLLQVDEIYKEVVIK